MTHDHEQRRLPELFTAEQWQSLAVATGLSRRQKEIARWICRGLSKGEIAKELSISTDTVRTHMRALFKTLNIHDRVGVPVRLVLAERDLPGEKPRRRSK